MSIKAFAIDTAKVVPLAMVKLFWKHAPDIIQFCMLVYAIGLAVQTLYRLWHWARGKLAAMRAPA